MVRQTDRKTLTTNPAPSDLNNTFTFPPFAGLPPEYDADEIHCSPTPTRLQRHWCFLGKIISSTVLVRLTLEVEDKEGNRILVAFHTDDRGASFRERCKAGRTVAVLYAVQHTFSFSPPGLRLEEDVHIRVFPCSLDEMLGMSRKLFERGSEKRCEACGKADASVKTCSNCKNQRYCSEVRFSILRESALDNQIVKGMPGERLAKT